MTGNGKGGSRTAVVLTRSLSETVATAVGHAERHDPVRARTGGPAGNALLTAWVGLVLLGLFLGELVTLLDVRGLISWHVAIGALLIPPALVKTASTGWRIVRYYRGDADYRRAGPPPLLLRLLGPVVIAGTLALLATGVLLVAIGHDASRQTLLAPLGFRIDWITLHQAAFAVWAVATGLHVLTRLIPAARLTSGRAEHTRRIPGRALRLGIIALLLISAAVTAFLLIRTSDSWQPL